MQKKSKNLPKVRRIFQGVVKDTGEKTFWYDTYQKAHDAAIKIGKPVEVKIRQLDEHLFHPSPLPGWMKWW